MQDRSPTVAVRHPALFALLNLPLGAWSGYVGVTLSYQLSHASVSTAAIGGIIALSISMSSWKVLWAPLVDLMFSYRGWYLATILAVAAGLAMIGFLPVSRAFLPGLSLIVFLMSGLSTFASVASDGLISQSATEAAKGRAGGWAQAGFLGGAGLSGGGGLWISTHAQTWVAGLFLGSVCGLAALSIFAFKEPRHDYRRSSYLKTLQSLGREVLALTRSRLGAMAIFLLLLPIGTGAASNLFASIAKDWSVSAGAVALVTGVLSGLVSIPGSLFGGYLADLWDRKAVYVLGGALMGVCAVAMAFAPKSEAMFVIFTLLYAATVGIVWGAYGGVVYEAAGFGAGATKCNILSSLCNIPIAVMVAVDGWAQTQWGPAGMLCTEAVCAAIAGALFIVVRTATGGRTTAAMAADPIV